MKYRFSMEIEVEVDITPRVGRIPTTNDLELRTFKTNSVIFGRADEDGGYGVQTVDEGSPLYLYALEDLNDRKWEDLEESTILHGDYITEGFNEDNPKRGLR